MNQLLKPTIGKIVFSLVIYIIFYVLVSSALSYYSLISVGMDFFITVDSLCLPETVGGLSPTPIPFNMVDATNYMSDAMRGRIDQCSESASYSQSRQFAVALDSKIDLLLFATVSYLLSCILIYWINLRRKKVTAISRQKLLVLFVVIIILLLIYAGPLYYTDYLP